MIRPRPLVSRLALVAPLLAIALAISPARAAEAPVAVAPVLTPAEVRTQLTEADLAAWDKLDREVGYANKRMEQGKSLLVPPRMTLNAPGAETAEQRRARGEAEIKKAQDALAGLEKQRAALHDKAAARVREEAVTLSVPVATLSAAFADAAKELMQEARDLRFTRVVAPGAVMNAAAGLVVEPTLSGTLRGALSAEDSTRLLESTEAGATAYILAEACPAKQHGGAFLAVRLIDGSLRVRRATFVFIPQAAPAPDAPALPVSVSLLDTNRFLAKLGPAAEWTFAVEGSGLPALVTKAVFASRTEPKFAESDALRRVFPALPKAPAGGEPGALWVAEADAESGAIRVGSRPAKPGAKVLPVGRIQITVPVPEKK